MSQTMHTVCLLLGSNIRAEETLPQAVELLRKHMVVLQTSSVWETPAVGSEGPNFLNAALSAVTPLAPDTLKKQLLRPLEAQLGRVRTGDKNAARTIDIDLVIFDQQVHDPSLWKFAHIAVPVSEILPGFQSESGEYLKDFALVVRKNSPIWIRDDVSVHPFSTVFQNHNARR